MGGREGYIGAMECKESRSRKEGDVIEGERIERGGGVGEDQE